MQEERLPGVPASPPRDCILVCCRTLNGLAALCLLLSASAFGMAIILRANAPLKDAYFVSGQAVRAWGIAWALLLLLVETEWRLVLKAAPLLESWLGRGLCQLFLAALTYREAYPRQDPSDFARSLELYRAVASAALLAVGTLYCGGGLLCMGAVRRARQRREEEYLAAESEIEGLERRRRELQRLLGRPNEP